MKSQDKAYRLINGLCPLTYTIQSRSTRSKALLWYDEVNNVNRPLRYARNQKSPFEDEQDGNAILEPIVFEDGMLFVSRTNPVLQHFLSLHPSNGSVFAEVDKEKEAQEEIEDLNVEVDALIKAKSLTMPEVENIIRVVFNVDPSKMTSAELKRDILVYAKTNPYEFMEVVSDSSLAFKSKVHNLFSLGYLSFRKNNTEIFFNLKNNKSKMINVSYGQDPYDAAILYFETEEGLPVFNMLNKLLEAEMGE